MLLVTRNGVKPVDLVPEIYLEDDIYLILSKDENLRQVLLDELKVDKIVADRLGEEKVPGILFEKEPINIKLPDVEDMREVGYYCRL